MQDVVKTASHGDEGVASAGFMVVIAVAATAFVFGLVATLNWQASALVALVATALTAGAIFTVVEMRRLAKEGLYTGVGRGNPQGQSRTLNGTRPGP